MHYKTKVWSVFVLLAHPMANHTSHGQKCSQILFEREKNPIVRLIYLSMIQHHRPMFFSSRVLDSSIIVNLQMKPVYFQAYLVVANIFTELVKCKIKKTAVTVVRGKA